MRLVQVILSHRKDGARLGFAVDSTHQHSTAMFLPWTGVRDETTSAPDSRAESCAVRPGCFASRSVLNFLSSMSSRRIDRSIISYLERQAATDSTSEIREGGAESVYRLAVIGVPACGRDRSGAQTDGCRRGTVATVLGDIKACAGRENSAVHLQQLCSTRVWQRWKNSTGSHVWSAS
jgi:hypothetical protein